MDIKSRSWAIAVDELERDLGKFVCTSDPEDTYGSDGDDNSEDDGHDNLEPYVSDPMTKCLAEAATFLNADKGSPCAAENEDENEEPEMALRFLFYEEPVQLHGRLSLPLVSAVKGSREKLGAAPRKLTVTWAPDVFDPVPNSLSYAVKGKQKKSRKDKDRDNNNYSKKNKKGQKGNSARGGGGKDKKQFRKHGGRSDRGKRTMDADDLDDFDLGSPDYCGSSFLKESPTKFRYVAEAS